MSSEDLFDDIVPETLTLERSPTSLGSTPIEASGVEGNAPVVEKAVMSQSDSSGFDCSVCHKVLKTKSGYSRHMAVHKLNDYNSRKPLEDEIKHNLDEFFKAVYNQIELEPAVGEMGAQKRKMAKALSTGLGSSAAVAAFQDFISPRVMECVLLKTKVMPSAQFEEGLKSLNHLLADSEFCEKAVSKLLLCSEPECIPPSLVMNRMIWRISSELMYKIQEFIFKQMRKCHENAHANFVLNEEDKEVFKIHIEDLLRAVYKFGHKSQNSVWKIRCQCLRERFVMCSHPVSDAEFLDRKLWLENIISLSDVGFSMFLGFEKIINSFQNAGAACTADSVFECVTNPENIVILNEMRQLSKGIMSEDLAFDFVKDLIKSLTAVSGKSHARRTLDKVSRKQHASTVSTRTNLKRDPKKKSLSSSSASTSKDTVGAIPPDSKRKKNNTTEQPLGPAKTKFKTTEADKKKSRRKKESLTPPSVTLKQKEDSQPAASTLCLPAPKEVGDSAHVGLRRSSRQRIRKDKS